MAFKNKDSVAGKVRSYVAANPKAKPKQIAEALGCNVERVYGTMHREKKLRKKARAILKAKVVESNTQNAEATNTRMPSPDFNFTLSALEATDHIRGRLTPEEFSGYLKGSVLKYSNRLNLGTTGGRKIDVDKLVWYSLFLKRLLVEA